MAIKYLKLMNELDLVAEVPDIQDGDGYLKVIKPAVIVMLNQAQGKTALTLQPYMMFTLETDFFLKEQHIFVITNVDPKIEGLYNQRFGNGLALPTEKSLVLP